MLIAIIGKICSGKSTISKYIEEEFGIKVLDMDKWFHLQYSNDEKIKYDIFELFKGYDVFTDGNVDRRKIAGIIFNNKNMMNNFTTYVKHIALDKMIQLKLEEGVNIIEAAMLYEYHHDYIPHKIIYVDCDDRTIINRLMNRNGLSQLDALKRLAVFKRTHEHSHYDLLIKTNNSKQLETHKQYLKEFLQKNLTSK